MLANKLIKEAVVLRTVPTLLETKIISLEKILQWLADNDITSDTVMAYAGISEIVPPNKHYIDSKTHFLEVGDKYCGPAIIFGIEPDLKYFDHIVNCALKYPDISIMCHNIRSSNNIQSLTQRRKYVEKLFPIDVLNEALIATDWCNKLKYTDKLSKLVLDRVQYLHSNYPIYYGSVGYKIYRKVVTKLVEENKLSLLTQDELIILNRLFRGIINPSLLTMSSFSYRISVMNNLVAGYILGFPIHEFTPSPKHIEQALKIIEDKGREEYIALITSRCQENNIYNTSDYTFANDSDVTMEDPLDYSPFDVIYYEDGSHVYRFTRVEFDNLLEKKKNHWTNEWLPTSILESIRSRSIIANKIGLPSSCTMSELFDKVDKDDLFVKNNNDNNHLYFGIQVTPYGPFISYMSDLSLIREALRSMT